MDNPSGSISTISREDKLSYSRVEGGLAGTVEGSAIESLLSLC